MRMEQAHFLALGAVLVALVWGVTQPVAKGSRRTHARLLALALGLGVIVVPGHGEIVAAPILAVIVTRTGHPVLMALAAFFAVFWWAVALGIRRWWLRRRPR